MKFPLDNPTVTKLHRLQGKMTQKEFAERLGISPAYLCDIYNGNRNPGKKITAALKRRKGSDGK